MSQSHRELDGPEPPEEEVETRDWDVKLIFMEKENPDGWITISPEAVVEPER